MGPKNGGKPCKGKSIKKKKCNTSKCPTADAVKKMHGKKKTVIKKPIVQIAPFSNRLQRYEKCVLKEVDAHLTTFNKKKNSKEKKIPMRVVMNNSTITIYKDDKYTNIYQSFDLEKTNFMIIKNHFCCVKITDSIVSANLCGYEKYCGKPKENKWANDWSDDFKLFKVSCRVGKMESLISPEGEAKLAESLRKKLGQSSASSNIAKSEEIKKQQLQSHGSSSPYVAKIVQTQNLGLKAISKEMKLEDLIRSEEKEKEEDEIHSIVQRIKAEKEKLIEKQKLMKIFIKLKLMQQRKNGKFQTSESVKTAGKKKTLATALSKKHAPERAAAKGPPQDGYWLMLQDWSPCSKKCNGGESFQQWQCVPPKNGGKPCKGKSIKKKKCNTSKCLTADAVKKMHG